jgi:hypothetical protein
MASLTSDASGLQPAAITASCLSVQALLARWCRKRGDDQLSYYGLFATCVYVQAITVELSRLLVGTCRKGRTLRSAVYGPHS